MPSGALNPLLKEVVFSDVNVSFTPHPVTGKLPVLKNADAVKRAVRNLILTNFGERPYEPLYGGNVRAMLFENTDDPLLQDQLRRQIEGAIKNYEKRAKVESVVVDVKPDSNALVVKIRFMVFNERFPVDLEVAIERVR
jgi:phage baseplate assembly protein W